MVELGELKEFEEVFERRPEERTASVDVRSSAVRIPIFPLWLRQARWIETGLVEIKSWGRSRVNFRGDYGDTPGFVFGKLGWMSVLGIKIPVPIFIYGVDKDGFDIFSFASSGWIGYIAFERR